MRCHLGRSASAGEVAEVEALEAGEALEAEGASDVVEASKAGGVSEAGGGLRPGKVEPSDPRQVPETGAIALETSLGKEENISPSEEMVAS